MLAQMSSYQIAEWMTYGKIEPFGDELIDLHFAKLDAIMTSTKEKPQEPKNFRIWQGEKKNFDPQDYFNKLKGAMSSK